MFSDSGMADAFIRAGYAANVVRKAHVLPEGVIIPPILVESTLAARKGKISYRAPAFDVNSARGFAYFQITSSMPSISRLKCPGDAFPMGKPREVMGNSVYLGSLPRPDILCPGDAVPRHNGASLSPILSLQPYAAVFRPSVSLAMARSLLVVGGRFRSLAIVRVWIL